MFKYPTRTWLALPDLDGPDVQRRMGRARPGQTPSRSAARHARRLRHARRPRGPSALGGHGSRAAPVSRAWRGDPEQLSQAAVWTPATDLLAASIAGRDFEKAVGDARYMLARVDEPKPPPADWRPFGIALVVLLSMGTYFIAIQARRGIRGHEAMRAKLTGFHARAALPYLLPGLVAVVVLVFIPLIVGAGLSLYTHEHGTFTFTGLQNFGRILFPPLERAFQSRSFYFALGVTVLWTLTNVVLHVSIGVVLASRPSCSRRTSTATPCSGTSSATR